MTAGTLYVGMSGWSYAHWAKGRFYVYFSNDAEANAVDNAGQLRELLTKG